MKNVLFIFLILCFSLTVISCGDDKEEYSATSTTDDTTTTTTDTTAPTVAEVTAVTTPTNDNTPDYTFSSSEAGTITYGGSCSSSTTSATTDNNTITLVSLSEGTYSDCTITVTDNSSNGVTLNMSSFVIDTTAPTVDNVSSSTTDGNYFPGENIIITVSFSENVIVDNSSGNPLIQLETGSTDQYATYASGNSSTVLSFLYTVQSNDYSSDLDYKATDSLSVNGGAIQDNASNDATLTLASPGATNSLGSNKALVVGGWRQQSYIKAANNDAGDKFGVSISISGDTLAVGTSAEDSNQTTITNGTTASSNNSNTDSGAVYVYKRSGTSWAQEAYIKAANSEAGDEFGYTVSLDNDTLAVGAYLEDSQVTTITNGTSASSDNNQNNSGAVYVYKRTGNNWAQESFIKAWNSDGSHDMFGYNVSLDNDTLAVGAYWDNSTGSVYIYKRTGSNWALEDYLRPVNLPSYKRFGTAISLDGKTLAVGAYEEGSTQTTITNGTTASSTTNSDSEQSGAVYVYKRADNSTWVQEAYIKAVNNDREDHFGASVALDNDTLAVGVRYEDSNQTTITNDDSTASTNDSNSSSGAVFVYKRTGTNWAQEAYIKAANNDSEDLFGWSVALEGDTLVVGAYQEDSDQSTITNGTSASSNDSNSESGAVYFYKRTGNNWAQMAYIKACDSGDGDRFGYSVSLDNGSLAVGAIEEDSNQTTITNGSCPSNNTSSSNSGAAYVFKLE